jgi:hypothetical protein
VSDPEYNAARRAKGLRAVAQGLNINLDLEVAIVCLNHAADKIEELEREREELKEQLDAAIMLGKMQERRHERDLEELIAAAKAVIDRWETPFWKEAAHTGAYIAALRKAVEIAEGGNL